MTTAFEPGVGILSLVKGKKVVLRHRSTTVRCRTVAISVGHLELEVTTRTPTAVPMQVVVGALVFNNENKVLLGRRLTAIGYGLFSLPGGHLEFGESFEECAAREVKEETGLDVTGLEVLTVTNNVCTDPKPVQLISIFLHSVLSDPNQVPINMEPEKCDGWGWYNLNDLPKPLFGPPETVIGRALALFPSS